MNHRRREVLKSGCAAGLWAMLVATGLITPSTASAASDRLFAATSLDAALAALGVEALVDSDAVRITVAGVVEDGRSVSIGIASSLPRTEQIVLLVEDNPYPAAASFVLAEGLRAEVRTRVKMNRSSTIHALVKADGRIFSARRAVKVTVSGCGV